MANCKSSNLLNLLREGRFVQSVEPEVNGFSRMLARVHLSNTYRLFPGLFYEKLHFPGVFRSATASVLAQ